MRKYAVWFEKNSFLGIVKILIPILHKKEYFDTLKSKCERVVFELFNFVY